MKRVLLPILVICVIALSVALLAVMLARPAAPVVVADLASPGETTIPTATMTARPTMTPTNTPTVTATATATHTLTPTNTLSTRVLVVTSVNADVTLDALSVVVPSTMPRPLVTLAVALPELRVTPLPPDGEGTDLVGWYQRDAADPAVQQIGTWQLHPYASHAAQRQYVYTDLDGSRLMYRFGGAAVRIRYVAFHTYGMFDVIIDGQRRDTIDSYAPQATYPRGEFRTTGVYGLPAGWHTLEILRTGRKTADSGGTFVGIDAIHLYKNGRVPTMLPTDLPATVVPTVGPRQAQHIQVLVAPPTVRPTATQGPPVVTSIDFSVAYDLNNNRVFDPAEGVLGLSVRLVRADTNQILSAGYTNATGFVRLEATGSAPLRLVVPYLGKFWDIQTPGSTVKVQLVIPAVNQPGLIP